MKQPKRLDPLNRRLVWDIIVEQNRKGATIVLVTHNVLEAERVVDRVAFINYGRLLEIDGALTRWGRKFLDKSMQATSPSIPLFLSPKRYLS